MPKGYEICKICEEVGESPSHMFKCHCDKWVCKEHELDHLKRIHAGLVGKTWDETLEKRHDRRTSNDQEGSDRDADGQQGVP